MKILKIILAFCILPIILVFLLTSIDDNKSLYKKANILIYRYSDYPSELKTSKEVLAAIKKIDNSTKYYKVTYARYLFYTSYENGDFDEYSVLQAKQYIDEAIKLDPDFFDAYFYGFYIYYQINEFEKADKLYKKAESLVFSNQEVRRLNYMSAEIALKNEDYDTALVYAQKVYDSVKNKEGVSSSLQIMITAYTEKGDYEKAESLYEEYIEVDPSVWVLYNYGTFLFKYKEDYNAAIKIYQKALDIERMPFIEDALKKAQFMSKHYN